LKISWRLPEVDRWVSGRSRGTREPKSTSGGLEENWWFNGELKET